MRNINNKLYRALTTFQLGAFLMIAVLAVSANTNNQVPLKGLFEGAGTEFSGNFTHLGAFDGVIDPGTFTAVWTAANGDTVTNQTVDFQLVEEISPNVFRYTQTIVITGGTGRFLNATGNANVVGTIDLNTGAFDGYLVGTISMPNPQ